MSERVVLVVRLRVDETSLEDYERFEQEAARVMADHGGRIERVIRRAGAATSDGPFEVHVASFPDEAAFAAYRENPATRALAATRATLVERTDVFVGREHPGYAPAPDVAGEVPAVSDRWDETTERLSTTYTFTTFPEAIAFMASCMATIEALDHHPDWANSHRRVHVVLTTHSAGCVTDLDRRLAAALDETYASL